jgi:hypothetical protein
MIRKTILLFLSLFGILLNNLTGQTSQSLYFMNLPQNHMMNPALRPSNSLYIGLPVLSGFNLALSNNFINFSDVIMKGQTGDELITFLHPEYNVDDFISKLKDKNSLSPQVAVQLLGLGFGVGKNGYVFLDINERAEGNIVIPGDLIELMLKGNEGFAGSKIDLSSLRGDLKYFHEVGVGYSRSYNKLRVGVKGKMLFGVSAVSIDNNSLGITVNEDYTHTLDADLTMNISAPVTVTMDEDQNIKSMDFDDSRFDTGAGVRKFLMSGKNFGLGLDIGATYEIYDNLIVSASITDLGFIKWKRDVTNLKADSRFDFSGLSMVDVLKGTKTIREVGDEMVDSLKNSFSIADSESPFTTYLPFGMTFGGNYKLTKDFSFGLLSYSRIIGKQFREALTLSANLNIGNSLSTTLCYTLANQRADNLGAGLAFRAGVMQFYLLADRLPLAWDKIKTEKNNTFLLPANWNTINLKVGMNLVFGNKISKKQDKPMVVVE